MRLKILSTLFFAITFTSIHAQDKLTIEDIWLRYAFFPQGADEFTPLRDGIHYVQAQPGASGTYDYLIHDYRSGAVTDTLVKGNSLIEQGSNKLIYPSGFSLSDDESRVLFTSEKQSIYRHSFVADYSVYDRKSKKLFNLSRQGKQQVCTLSPDGRYAAYVRDNNLYLQQVETGDETAITTDGKRNFLINGLCDWVYEEEFSFTQAYQWSPDGKCIAFYRFDESAVPEMTIQFFNGLYPENYTYKYPKVGETNSTVSIYIYDLGSKKITHVDVGSDTDQYIPRIKWTEDPEVLCITRMNRLQNKLELLLADAATGKTRVMFTEEDKRYIEINDNLTFYNHNHNFIWTSDRSGYNQIYSGNMTTGKLTPVTTGDYEVTAFYGLDEKRKLVYYQSTEVSPLERYVYSISLNGDHKKQLTLRKGTNAAAFNSAHTFMMVSHSDANTPPDYSLCDAHGKVIRVLQDNAALKSKLAAYDLSPKEFFQFTTAEGVTLNGYMIKPSHFDAQKKYPVFMFAYGGPGSQQVLNAWGGQNLMFFEYLAQQGYLVACVDNRGTGGRGAEFTKMTYLQLGKYEPADQIAAARYLGSLPYVDASRIGFFGWSFGGYLSTLCIELGADVFKAAIAVAPVTDWRYYDSIYTERYMRTDKENHEGYEAGSPVTYADRIKGHFLLIAGLADDNVHYQNTAMLLKNLYANNVQFDQMTFPDKNHGISGGNTRYYLYTSMAGWLKENL